MYSLFWKIFLTYWLTILVIEVFTAWVTADLSEYEIHPILEKQNEQFISSSTKAVSILTSEGLPGLHAWLQNKTNLQAINEIFVFNRYREEINGKSLPNNVAALIENDYDQQTLINHTYPVKHHLNLKTITPAGEEYFIVTTFEHPPLLEYLLAPQRVVFSVLISGLICFFLARYFTSPLSKLRRSTQMLTMGAFDTDDLRQLQNRSDEFGALAKDFENMTMRLKDLLDAQRQLLRDISHELRSPLARIQVALGLARNKIEPAGNEEIDRIEYEIERLEFLIRELLTFVKIEPRDESTITNKVAMHELLQEVVHDTQYERQKYRAANTINLHCDQDVIIDGDARLLHRAIENIVRNACYYTPAEGVINISCDQQSDHVCIIVEDHGPGVPQEMLEKIFQPFVRVSTARETYTGGSGIGLAIAKRVIDIHNGTVTATNKPQGDGLIVTVILPISSQPVTKSAA